MHDRESHRDPVIGEGLGELRSAVMERWKSALPAKLERKAGHDHRAIKDDVPAILDLVDEALRHSGIPESSRFEPARQHGWQRARMTDHDLDEVFDELRLLRDAVLTCIEERDGKLGGFAHRLIFEVFERTGESSAVTFLEQVVAAEREARRQAEETAAQLAVVRKELEDERELRDTFVAAAAHDLRTPLSLMSLSLSVLAEPDAPPKEREIVLARAQRAVRRIDELAQRLLDVSRLAAGEALEVDCDPIDVAAVCREAAGDLAAVHGHDHVLYEGPDRGIELDSNRMALRRILENLVINGLKYGDGELVTIQLDESSAGEVIIEVHNTGDPIPEPERERIFERFVRLDRRRGGWGVGLTVVRGLVEALGGSVRALAAKASEGGGTTFRIELPPGGDEGSPCEDSSQPGPQ